MFELSFLRLHFDFDFSLLSDRKSWFISMIKIHPPLVTIAIQFPEIKLNFSFPTFSIVLLTFDLCHGSASGFCCCQYFFQISEKGFNFSPHRHQQSCRGSERERNTLQRLTIPTARRAQSQQLSILFLLFALVIQKSQNNTLGARSLPSWMSDGATRLVSSFVGEALNSDWRYIFFLVCIHECG